MRRFPSTVLALALAALTLGSGCLDSSHPPAATTETQLPSTGATATTPGPTQRPIVGGSAEPKANLTDCQGSQTIWTVPTSWIADDLPENYTANSVDAVAAGLTGLQLEMTTCAKVSVDGVDYGPATLAFVTTPIENPGRAATENLDGFQFLFEAQTDNPVLRQWLSDRGAQVGSGGVTNTNQPLSLWYADVLTELNDAGTLVYRVHGVAESDPRPEGRLLRYYYGPNAETDYLDDELVSMESSEGAATFEMAESSALARIFGDNTPPNPLLGPMDQAARLILPPAHLSEGES